MTISPGLPAIFREFLERNTEERNDAAIAEGPEHDYALVIGVNDYCKLRPLRGAIADAQAFQKWLLDTNGGRVPVANVHFIASTPDPLSPIGHEINDALEELLERASAKGGRRFYFYFSGHGCVGDRANDLSLCMANWSELRRRAALSSEAWLDVVVRSGAFSEIAFFLDCCRVWAIRAVGLPPHIDYVRPVERERATRVFMAYATEFQRPALETSSGDSTEIRGVFTRVLIEGLSGKAADRSAMVTAESLKRYLDKNVAEEAKLYGLPQRAEVMNGLDSDALMGFATKLHKPEIQSPIGQHHVSSMRLCQLSNVPSFSRRESWKLPNPIEAWLPIRGWGQRRDRSVAIAAAWLNPLPMSISVIAHDNRVSSRLLVIMLESSEPGPTVPLGAGWSLHRGENAIHLDTDNTWHADGSNGSAFSALLASGTWTLRWRGKHDIAVHLYPAFTTQIVIDHVNGKPNLERPRIYVVNGIQCPHEPPGFYDTKIVESGLMLLGSVSEDSLGDWIPDLIQKIIKTIEFDDPVLGLLAAYLMVLRKISDPDRIDAIVNRVEALIGPCPDVHALRLRTALFRGTDLPNEACTEPPLFREGLLAFIEASYHVPEIIVPGSLLEHACVHRFVDSPISSWPTMEEVGRATWLDVAIADVASNGLKQGKTIDERTIARELSVPTLAVRARLRADVTEYSESEETSAMMPSGRVAIVDDALMRPAENKFKGRKKLEAPVFLVPRMMATQAKSAFATFDNEDHFVERIVKAIDGVLPIEDVIDNSKLDRAHALSILYKLVLQGIIEIARVTPEVP